MRGFVLALVCLTVPVSAFCESLALFEFASPEPSFRDPALILRKPLQTTSGSVEIVSDSRSETRGSRPSVAYTLFRFDWQRADASIQPVFGRINGAQVKLTW